MTAVLPAPRVGDVYDEGAWVYEALVRDDRSEVDTLLALTRGRRGPVLDLGCGGGRLTMPFLARGCEVVAVDSSPAMLTLLNSAAAGLPARMARRLDTRLADMSALPATERRYDVVLLGTTTVTLLDPVARARTFAYVAAHLRTNGVFLVSTMWFRHDPPAGCRHVTTVPDPEGRTARVTVAEAVDVAAGHRTTRLLVERPPGPHGTGEAAVSFTSRPRMLPEAQLRAELAAAGLAVIDRRCSEQGNDGRVVQLLSCRAGVRDGD